MIFVFAVSLPTEWFITRQDAATSGGALVQATFLAFFGVTILGMNDNWHVMLRAIGKEPLLPALLGLAGLSTLWSAQPAATVSTVLVLTITYIVGVYLVMRFTLSEIIFYAGIALALALTLNFIMIFVFPASGLQNDQFATINDSWSGVFRSRNTLARLDVVSVVIFWVNARVRRSWVLWPGLSVLAIIQILGTGSATALGSIIALGALTMSLLGFRARKSLYGATAVVMGTIFSIVVATAAINLEAATALVGRDATFTGRLPLWINSIKFGILERPWFGHGWGAFWTGGGADFEVLLNTNFRAPHSHNAFIDTWLQVGPIGAIFLAAIYLRGLFWAARNIRRDPTSLGLFPAVMISTSILFSLTETGFVSRSTNFILLVVALLIAADNKGIQRPFMPESTSKSQAKELVASHS